MNNLPEIITALRAKAQETRKDAWESRDTWGWWNQTTWEDAHDALKHYATGEAKFAAATVYEDIAAMLEGITTD